MKNSEAEKHRAHIEEYCKKHGIWFEEQKNYRPKLGMVEMRLYIKVDSDD